jgi:hypothetical protein
MINIMLEGCNGNETNELKISEFRTELCTMANHQSLSKPAPLIGGGEIFCTFGNDGRDGLIAVTAFNDDPSITTHPKCVNIKYVDFRKDTTHAMNKETVETLCKKYFGGSNIDVGARHRAAAKRDNRVCNDGCCLCAL